MKNAFDVGGRLGRKLSGDDFGTIPEIWSCVYKAKRKSVPARPHWATLLNSTKKLFFCLCNFIRLRLFPMVYFSICSQPIEESQGGKPTRLHDLPTL